MLPLISYHWWRDSLNKNKNIERLGDKQKQAACCEVCVVEKTDMTVKGNTTLPQGEEHTNGCQGCTEFSFTLPKTIYCISSVQQCGRDCCCDQKSQTQLSLLRAKKATDHRNHPCPWQQLKCADLRFDLRHIWMNFVCVATNSMTFRCSSGNSQFKGYKIS